MPYKAAFGEAEKKLGLTESLQDIAYKSKVRLTRVRENDDSIHEEREG